MEKLLKFSSIFALIFVILINSIASNLVFKKFEYKYSFKPPYLAQRDGSVPFWESGGNAIASMDNVRLAPSLKSQKGAIWGKKQVSFDFWEVDIAFRVSGRGRIGADGMAFWYVQQKGDYNGPAFGSSDKWNGLAIFFDSFDNDNKHNNPYIYAVVNDGNIVFDHSNDGTNQQLAGCMRDFRNKPFPTRARIDYYNNVLTVLVHNGMSNNEADYEMCFRVENVHLPKNGYFGVSAATGGLADDHDVIHFLTSSYGSPRATDYVINPDQQKLEDEYQEYQKKLEDQQEQYKKEHPDLKKEPEDWFESDDERELRQIYQNLAQIHESTRELNKKLDEVIGKQQLTMSLVSQQQTGAVGSNVPPPPQGQQPPSDTIRRHEVDALFNSQNKIDNIVAEIRNFVLEVKQRVDTVINNQAKAPTAQVQSVGYDTQSLVSEMRDGLNHVKMNMAQMATQLNTKDGCPNVNCVSVTTVLIIVFVQLLIVLGYNIYRDSKEGQSKKFY